MSANNPPKVILITGTSSGFGMLFSARLAARGHIVYATMRDLKNKKPLLIEAAKRNGEVLARELDVTKPATIAKVIEEIKSDQGRIDVLVNNAGWGLGGFFEDLLEEEIRAQMEVNFFGVQSVCRQVVPLMRQQRQGLIINMSSVGGQTATACLGAYNASKWALEAFSESLYYELAAFGVKVVLVEPGTYPTKIFKENARYAKNYDNPDSPYFELSQRLRIFVQAYTRKSKKDPEEVARLVERIIHTPRPRLRYVSDFSSKIRMLIGKTIPAPVYEYIHRKVIYGRSTNPL